MYALDAVLQPTSGASIETLPLFVLTLVVGVISFPLLWWGSSSGFGLTTLTAILGLLDIGLVLTETVGLIQPGIPYHGRIQMPAFVLLAVALIISTFLAQSE